MADVPPKPDSHGNAGEDSRSRPRWVKVFGILIVILVLVFVIMHLTSGDIPDHTPR
jgi:uncharacterized integral membrane protein